jgi:hypothetical protein
MKNFVFYKNKLFTFLIYITLLIDLFLGSILIEDRTSSPLIGLVYKAILLIIVVSYITKLNKISFYSLIVLFALTLFNSISDNIIYFPSNFISGSKFILFNLMFFLFSFFYKKKYIDSKSIFKIISFSFIILIINQFLGFFGFGKSTYEHINIGTTGFFFESNSYALILIIIEATLILFFISSIKLWKLLSLIIIFSLLALTVATKTAIIGSVIIPLIIIYFKRKKIFYFMFIFLSLIALSQIENIEKMSEISKISNEIDNMGLVDGVSSGRSDRASIALNNYLENFSFIEKLVGIGNNRMIKDINLGGFSEIDFIDILLSAGIIGFLLVYFPFFIISYNLLLQNRKNKIIEFKIVFILNVFFLVISSLGGHLFTSGSPTIFLALLNIYPYTLIQNQSKKILLT